MANTFTGVDEYIEAQAPRVQPRLRELRAIIREAVPEANEFISYAMPTYRHGKRRVHFAAAKNHVGLYGAAMDQFADELRDFKILRGTVQFPLDKPIPADLVRRLVEAKLRGDQG